MPKRVKRKNKKEAKASFVHKCAVTQKCKFTEEQADDRIRYRSVMGEVQLYKYKCPWCPGWWHLTRKEQ